MRSARRRAHGQGHRISASHRAGREDKRNQGRRAQPSAPETNTLTNTHHIRTHGEHGEHGPRAVDRDRDDSGSGMSGCGHRIGSLHSLRTSHTCHVAKHMFRIFPYHGNGTDLFVVHCRDARRSLCLCVCSSGWSSVCGVRSSAPALNCESAVVVCKRVASV